MRHFLMLLFLLTAFLFEKETHAQYIIIPEGDTLMVVAENGTITDISGNYMGVIESDGTVKNGQNLVVGRIDTSTGKIYNSLNDELATLSNNQLTDLDQVAQGSIQNNSVYDASNNLLGTFYSLDALKAVFLLMYYF